MDKESWCLNSDGTIRHNNQELYRLTVERPPSPSGAPGLVTADLLNNCPPSPSGHVATAATGAHVTPVEGDTVGVAYDHIQINFFLNGQNMEIPISNVKGTVFPALYGEFRFIFHQYLNILGML